MKENKDQAYKSPIHRLVATKLAENGDSTRTAASRSHGLISHSRIGEIARGKSLDRMSESTIAGLALALGVAEREVRDALAETVTPAEFDSLRYRMQSLSASKQRELMDAMTKAVEDMERRNNGPKPGRDDEEWKDE